MRILGSVNELGVKNESSCPLVLEVLCPMEYYNTPTGVSDGYGPDVEGQEQRRLTASLVEGVEVEGEVQQEQAQFQPQIEEVSHDDRRGRGTLYIQLRQAAEIPLC
jgi:hypothetical protein